MLSSFPASGTVIIEGKRTSRIDGFMIAEDREEAARCNGLIGKEAGKQTKTDRDDGAEV